MTDDAWHDALVDYAYYCMDKAGWKYVDCPNCGCPRLQKVNILTECEECGDAETEVLCGS